MTWSDAASAASTIATIVAAGFTIAEFFRKRARGTRAAAWPSKAPIVIVAVLAVVSWGAVAFDYFDRHSRPFAYSAVINQWGIAAPLNYYLEANTSALSEYKATHKLMLILRVPFAEFDRMTDKNVEKSGLYSISGGPVMMAHPTSGKLRFVPLTPTPVEFDLVLLPNGISAEQVGSLADVEMLVGDRHW
ncbi:MAG: hypothetical protein ACAH22_08630 [Tardiphaga sp.]